MNGSYLARRASLVAACLGAAAAVGTTPAFAATTTPGINIYGSGSSAQNVAQTGASAAGWLGWAALWHNNPTKYQTTISGDPTFTYTKTQSGAGLNEFGNNTGVLDPTQDGTANGAGTLDAQVGTDDPPTAAQLAQAKAASGSAEVTIPDLQSPIALVLSLPSALTEGTNGVVNLTNAEVRQLFDAGSGATATNPLDNVPSETQPASGSGTTRNPGATYAAGTWGALLLETGHQLLYEPSNPTPPSPTATQFTDSTLQRTGSPDATKITVEVRNNLDRSKTTCNGGSGTTYNLQGFLDLSGDSTYRAPADNGPWSTNLAVSDGTPIGSACTTSTVNLTNPAGINTGGSSLVKNVLGDPGTAGYAVISDAALAVPGAGTSFTNVVQRSTYSGSASHQILFAAVQNNDGNTPAKYAVPGAVTISGSTVTTTSNVYTGSRVFNTNGSLSNYSLANGTTKGVGAWTIPSTVTGTWNPTIAGDPNVANHATGATVAYPITLASYNLSWANYSTTALNSAFGSATNATEVGNTDKSLEVFETGAGQSLLEAGKAGYTLLPTGVDTNAKAAAASIAP